MVANGIFMCRHVLEMKRRVKLVAHHTDGMWQVMRGENDHSQTVPDLHFLCMHHLTDLKDGPLKDALDNLAPGFLTEDRNGIWVVEPFDE